MSIEAVRPRLVKLATVCMWVHAAAFCDLSQPVLNLFLSPYLMYNFVIFLGVGVEFGVSESGFANQCR